MAHSMVVIGPTFIIIIIYVMANITFTILIISISTKITTKITITIITIDAMITYNPHNACTYLHSAGCDIAQCR